ncbi:MAG: hypothetical protein ACJARP_002061 [Vicingaceae bacterium]|jgi:hypothetical protein
MLFLIVNFMQKMKFLYLFLFSISCTQLNAQFTYLEADLAFQFIKYEKGDLMFDNQKIQTNSFSVIVSAIHRPTRFMGLGLSLGLPMAQSTRWGFQNAPLTSGSLLEDNDNSFSSGEFAPDNYDYSIRHSPTVTLFGRLFFKPNFPLFIDLRYTFLSIEETFTFERNTFYPVDINFSGQRQARGPGLSFVLNHIFQKGFYINYKYSVDFLTFNRLPTFSYDILYDSYSNRNISARIASPIETTHNMHSWIFGFGYYF